MEDRSAYKLVDFTSINYWMHLNIGREWISVIEIWKEKIFFWMTILT